jgi:hypothetical protein
MDNYNSETFKNGKRGKENEASGEAAITIPFSKITGHLALICFMVIEIE